MLRRRRGTHAHDQAGGRYQSIIGSKHRGPKPTYTIDQMIFFVERTHEKCS
jgi:hypothetical protein